MRQSWESGAKKGGGSKEGLREKGKRMKREQGEKGGEQQREVSSRYSLFSILNRAAEEGKWIHTTSKLTVNITPDKFI